MTSDGEMTKIKVVDLEKLKNFVADNFFHLNSVRVSNTYFKFGSI